MNFESDAGYDYPSHPEEVPAFGASLSPRGGTLLVPKLADVVLGQPQSGCRYHGICRIEAPNSSSPSGCRGRRVRGLLSGEGPTSCRLIIPRCQLDQETQRYYFGAGRIRLHRRQSLRPFWELPGQVAYLRADDYPLSITPTHYNVELKIYLAATNT
ncbi:MAG: hypothetical protein AAF597_18625 [Bacteroidota bacterium]